MFFLFTKLSPILCMAKVTNMSFKVLVIQVREGDISTQSVKLKMVFRKGCRTLTLCVLRNLNDLAQF